MSKTITIVAERKETPMEKRLRERREARKALKKTYIASEAKRAEEKSRQEELEKKQLAAEKEEERLQKVEAKR